MDASDVELWGGIECTVNRVGDTYFDQLERTGHASRIDDLDRVASLGIRTLRYPILWERTARAGSDEYDFSWADARMHRLRELGIRVIVGLVHHGSGPSHTNLLDEGFVHGLARFAHAVAKRYPWVQDYTPVNEPMTTARFSALYGHWYPHKRDATAFVRALLIQVRATQAAMSAIRNVVSSARLVQTEDFGRVFSTPKLKYQAAFENHRQWLGLDLLFGRVTRHHPMYRYLVTHGISERELGEIEQQPFPPDCIGVNYYVTSDRFLDDRLARYPIGSHGSNGRDHYVDVEAVRVREEGIVGHEGVLKSAWTRYATPLALTEVHLGCTPDEQVRWLLEAWCAARAVRSAGVDVGAVTIWSLFGAYDWDSLVTTARGHYEAGAFDIRGKIPQPTALCEFAERLGQDPEFVHPLASAPGWWRSNKRFLQGEPDAAEEILSAASTRE